MATETLTDLELFHKFIGKELERGHKKMKVQECLERFEAYRRDVEKLQQMLQPALEAAARGEGKEIDWEEFHRRNAARLRAMGIPE